jgi:hypothetical protein
VIPLLTALEAARKIPPGVVKRENLGLNIDKLQIRLRQDQLGAKGKDRREGVSFKNQRECEY